MSFIKLTDENNSNIRGSTLIDELRVLVEIVQTVFGTDIKYRFLDDTFPYTDPSTQIVRMVDSKWVEILGAGIIKPSVLEKMGIVVDTAGWVYLIWAWGLAILSMELPTLDFFGLEDEP